MSGFTPEWLALREPVDAAARSTSTTTFVTDSLRSRSIVRALDLGCGTGANVRYLSQYLPSPVDWHLVDHDRALLDAARRTTPRATEHVHADLRSLDPRWFVSRDLVTASALLDLVSDAWLTRFIGLAAEHACAVLVALSYDGRIESTPRDADDDWVRDLVNAHQRTDKGFGPALGPSAGPRCDGLLRQAGFDTQSERSDWQVGPESAHLQRELIRGWAAAAVEITPADRLRVIAWEARRLAYVDAGHSHLIVGHVDVGGVPPRRRQS